jgi:hypothetical protein
MVVDDDEFVITAQLYIELNAIGTPSYGSIEGFHGVFRKKARSTAMGVNEWGHVSFLLSQT